MNWLNLLRGKHVTPDPFGIVAALDARKANRAELKAEARSDAARKGWETRREKMA